MYGRTLLARASACNEEIFSPPNLLSPPELNQQLDGQLVVHVCVPPKLSAPLCQNIILINNMIMATHRLTVLCLARTFTLLLVCMTVHLPCGQVKAHYRHVCASMKLERYADAIEWCDRGLSVDPKSAELADERQKAVKAKVRD